MPKCVSFGAGAIKGCAIRIVGASDLSVTIYTYMRIYASDASHTRDFYIVDRASSQLFPAGRTDPLPARLARISYARAPNYQLV